MNNEITREGRAIGWLITISIVLLAVGFFIIALSEVGVLGYTPQPVSDPVEPDPFITGNVTKDSHESTWSLVQYEDDYGDVETLPGFTAETIYLNYSAIDGHQNYDIGGVNWSDPDDWTQGSCDMSNPAIQATEHGLSFYADPTGAVQTCWWDLNIASFGVVSNTKWSVGAYFEEIGGSWQRIYVRLQDPDATVKQYAAWSDEAEVPSEAAGTLYVANRDRATIFETQTVNTIGTDDLEIEQVDSIHVYFHTSSGTDPMKVELFFMDFGTTIYRVGTSPTGNSVYRQLQSDNGTVELGTFSPTFDYANIDNLNIGYKQRASDLPDEYVEISRTESLCTYRFSFPQPEAISLHYEDVVLRDKLNQAGSAFRMVKLNGEDITHRYDPLSKGDEIVLLEGILEGEQPAIYFETAYSAEDYENIVEGEEGGYGGIFDFGGITPELMAPFVALGILVAILAVVLIQKFKKSREERPAAGEGEESGRGVEVEVRVR